MKAGRASPPPRRGGLPRGRRGPSEPDRLRIPRWVGQCHPPPHALGLSLDAPPSRSTRSTWPGRPRRWDRAPRRSALQEPRGLPRAPPPPSRPRGHPAALARRSSGVLPRVEDPRRAARPGVGASRGGGAADLFVRKTPSQCRSHCSPTHSPNPHGSLPWVMPPAGHRQPEPHARRALHRGPEKAPGVPTPRSDGAADAAASGDRGRSSRARCRASAMNGQGHPSRTRRSPVPVRRPRSARQSPTGSHSLAGLAVPTGSRRHPAVRAPQSPRRGPGQRFARGSPAEKAPSEQS